MLLLSLPKAVVNLFVKSQGIDDENSKQWGGGRRRGFTLKIYRIYCIIKIYKWVDDVKAFEKTYVI